MHKGKYIAGLLLLLFSVQLLLHNKATRHFILGDVLTLIEPLCLQKQQQKNSTREAQWEKTPLSPMAGVAVNCQQTFVLVNCELPFFKPHYATEIFGSDQRTPTAIALENLLPPPKLIA